MLARVLISCMYIDLGNVWWIITGELYFLHKKKQKGDWKINVITGYFFGFRKIDIEDSLEESLHWISGCLYRWTLCLGCAKCWWVLYNAYIFNRKNTLNLSLFKHVSQELLMVFWKKKVKRMNGGVYTIEIMENFEQLDFKHMAKRICLAQHSPSIVVKNYRYTVF